MKITNASATWQSVTTAADEIWMSHDGSVMIDTDATEADRLGVRLAPGETIAIPTGTTVYYRLASGTSAVVARVAL